MGPFVPFGRLTGMLKCRSHTGNFVFSTGPNYIIAVQNLKVFQSFFSFFFYLKNELCGQNGPDCELRKANSFEPDKAVRCLRGRFKQFATDRTTLSFNPTKREYLEPEAQNYKQVFEYLAGLHHTTICDSLHGA